MYLKLNKNYAVATLALLLAGCASDSNLLSWSNNSTKSPDLDQYQTDSQMKINTKIANVIFIRNANVNPNLFVNVYVDDHYLGSLRNNGFKQQNVCSLKQKITVNADNLKGFSRLGNATKYFDFSRDRVNVVEISQINNNLSLNLLDNNSLDLKYIESLKQQTNTVSRAKNYICSSY